MEIGINLECYSSNGSLPIEYQVELMKTYGFTRTFTMSDSPSLTDENVNKVTLAGISYDTLHAPFKGINNMWTNSDSGEIMLKKLFDGVEKCKCYSIPTLIVHCSAGIPAPRINDIGMSRFDRLMEHAAKHNITIAYENQRYLANISLMFEQYPEARFCWDTGHEGCFTPGRQYMPLFSDKLVALHIHDNNCEFDHDLHMISFDGKIDFKRVVRQIVQANYNGSIMLEVFNTNLNMYSHLSPEEFYSRASIAAKKLSAGIENFK